MSTSQVGDGREVLPSVANERVDDLCGSSWEDGVWFLHEFVRNLARRFSSGDLVSLRLFQHLLGHDEDCRGPIGGKVPFNHGVLVHVAVHFIGAVDYSHSIGQEVGNVNDVAILDHLGVSSGALQLVVRSTWSRQIVFAVIVPVAIVAVSFLGLTHRKQWALESSEWLRG